MYKAHSLLYNIFQKLFTFKLALFGTFCEKLFFGVGGKEGGGRRMSGGWRGGGAMKGLGPDHLMSGPMREKDIYIFFFTVKERGHGEFW